MESIEQLSTKPLLYINQSVDVEDSNLRPLRLSSLSSVTTCRAPVQPKGWPSAIAPPLGFTFSIGIPSFSTQYTAWNKRNNIYVALYWLLAKTLSNPAYSRAGFWTGFVTWLAKASLISKTSTSATVRPGEKNNDLTLESHTKLIFKIFIQAVWYHVTTHYNYYFKAANLYFFYSLISIII